VGQILFAYFKKEYAAIVDRLESKPDHR